MSVNTLYCTRTVKVFKKGCDFNVTAHVFHAHNPTGLQCHIL